MTSDLQWDTSLQVVALQVLGDFLLWPRSQCSAQQDSSCLSKDLALKASISEEHQFAEARI